MSPSAERLEAGPDGVIPASRSLLAHRMRVLTPVRRRILGALLLLVPLGIATKFYTGPADGWVQAHLGGVLYVVFWTGAVLWVCPGLAAWKAAAGVFVGTCLVEVTQLWAPAPLEVVRDTFVGHALLGATFSWADLLYYGVGALLGVGMARMVRPGPDTPGLGTPEPPDRAGS